VAEEVVEKVAEEVVAEEPAEKEVVAEEPAKEETEGKSQEDLLPPLGQDYSNSSKAELVAALRLLLDRRTIQEIRKEVETIKAAFYKRHRQETEEKRKNFST